MPPPPPAAVPPVSVAASPPLAAVTQRLGASARSEVAVAAWHRGQVWACWPSGSTTQPCGGGFERVWPSASGTEASDCRPVAATFSGTRTLWLTCEDGTSLRAERGTHPPRRATLPAFAQPRRPVVNATCDPAMPWMAIWDPSNPSPGPVLHPCLPTGVAPTSPTAPSSPSSPTCDGAPEAAVAVRMPPRLSMVRAKLFVGVDLPRDLRVVDPDARAGTRRDAGATTLWFGLTLGLDPERARRARASARALQQRIVADARGPRCR